MNSKLIILMCVSLSVTVFGESDFSKLNPAVADEFDFYSFFAVDINDNIVSFEQYRGMVSLVVNVASECGYTDGHYRNLNLVNGLFHDTQKFNILAFPCDQFGGQEPGTLQQIHNFAYKRMGATFQLFSKVEVVGDNRPAFWEYLVEHSGKSPTWNFWKYLVDHEGKVLGAWGPTVSPEELYQYIENAIDKIDGGLDSDEESLDSESYSMKRDEF